MEIWYINLERRNDRKDIFLREMAEKNVPSEKIVRIDATDRDAFETPNALVEYAESIGFPEFQICIKSGNHLTYLGYMVSYFRSLDLIAQQTKNVLLMEDDYSLTENYEDVCDLFNELPNPVYFAMLGYNKNNKQLITDLEPLSDNSVWQRGVPANGNMANIYTPRGARFLLDRCKKGLPQTPETIIEELRDDVPFIYSRKIPYIGIRRPVKKGDTDVRNDNGRRFTSKLIKS